MKVVIFSTCIVDLFFPNVGAAMVEVLERFGCETFMPFKQFCCGLPTFNSGYVKESQKVFRNEIDALLSVDADYIVGPAGSCVNMLREYRVLLKDDPEYAQKAKEVADKMYEFSQFLYRVLNVIDAGAELDTKDTYHRSCPMPRLLGERTAPFALREPGKDYRWNLYHILKIVAVLAACFLPKSRKFPSKWLMKKSTMCSVPAHMC